MEMERAGLDAADTYRGISGNTLPGDWGIVESNGFRKPAWWMFRAWQRMTGNRIASTGDDPEAGFWARATRDGDQVSVLLSTWIATGGSARSASVQFDNGCALFNAQVSTLDAGSTDFETSTLLPVRNGLLELELGEQSVTWVQATCVPEPEQALGTVAALAVLSILARRRQGYLRRATRRGLPRS